MLDRKEAEEVVAKDMEARRLFPLWWKRYGKKFETLVQSAVKKEEIASYAFIAGYVAGRLKTLSEIAGGKE